MKNIFNNNYFNINNCIILTIFIFNVSNIIYYIINNYLLKYNPTYSNNFKRMTINSNNSNDSNKAAKSENNIIKKVAFNEENIKYNTHTLNIFKKNNVQKIIQKPTTYKNKLIESDDDIYGHFCDIDC